MRQATTVRPAWLDARGRVIDEEDRGLVYDLQTLVDRRRVLGLLLAGDMVFRDDGAVHQLATMSGDAAKGFTAALTIGV
jgi:hypothetical protein